MQRFTIYFTVSKFFPASDSILRFNFECDSLFERMNKICCRVLNNRNCFLVCEILPFKIAQGFVWIYNRVDSGSKSLSSLVFPGKRLAIVFIFICSKFVDQFCTMSGTIFWRRNPFEIIFIGVWRKTHDQNFGYIDVGDRCWRRNLLATTLSYWWRFR